MNYTFTEFILLVIFRIFSLALYGLKNLFFYFFKVNSAINLPKNIIKILSTCLVFILLSIPFAIQAEEIDLTDKDNQGTLNSPETKVPKKMSQEQIDEMLGLDPYLGPTSWLGSQGIETK